MDTTKPYTADVTSTSGTKIVTSNQFDALYMDDTDAFGIPTNDTNKDVESGCNMEANEDESLNTGNASQDTHVSNIQEKEHCVGSTPIVKKIGELEKLIIDGKATLVDDDGHPIQKVVYPPTSSSKRSNPFSKVGEVVVSDSDDEEVVDMFDESANLFGGGHDREDEYDDYDEMTMMIILSKFMIFQGIWTLLMPCMALSSKLVGSSFSSLSM